MFERPHHQRIARLLEALDGPLLRERQCLFGGGTAITLRYGEYRESVDVDFLVSAKEQYRDLRNAMTGRGGVRAIMRADAPMLEQFNRDLVDLAMMRPALPLLMAAVAKAAGAYGDAILRDLGRAIERMQSRAGWLERCMQAMAMTDPPALVWQRIRALRRVLPGGAKDGRR
jgi:hypothetical protein